MDHTHVLAAPYSLEWFARWFVHVFEFEVARYSIAAFGAFAIVNLVLARALSERKIRPASPPRAQLFREMAASVRTCAVYAGISLITIAGIEAGVLRSYDDPAALGWGWFWASIIVLIVLHDAFFYWTHRLMHDPRLFRRFHRLHHKSHNPSPFTAYSFDATEAAVHGVFVTLVLLFIPVSGTAIFIFLAHMIIRNVIGHSGYELFPARRDGRPLFGWMTSVTHHDLHHAQAGWNYGLYFTWWDRLMKTEHPLYAEKFAEAVRRPLDGSAVGAMGKRRLSTLALVAAASLILAPGDGGARAAADDPVSQFAGVWATEGHGAHVELYACPDNEQQLCGALVWSFDPSVRDRLDGGQMLGDFRWNGASFEDGWLKNPEDGRTYRGKISMAAEGALSLKGCALVFCRSQIWRRIEDIPGCAPAAVSAIVSEEKQ